MTVQERLKVQREPRRQINGRSARLILSDGTTELECSVLDVAPGGVRITAACAAGLFYGTQTLRQLLTDAVIEATPLHRCRQMQEIRFDLNYPSVCSDRLVGRG